ncbi:MAG: hypothetical protein GF398_14110 [Chitinivibrionales bacterium]|nr:hypothetical protein [Chitinivibrionales bacterium]
MKKRIYEILEKASADDSASKAFDAGMISLIILNVIANILKTVRNVRAAAGPRLSGFEIASICIFTIEYLLRIITCTENPKYVHPV